MHIDSIKRAIQISALNPYQLERLHELETKTNYLLPNWNIQEIFGLDSLKYTYNVGTDTCADYCREIEQQLKEKGIDKMAEPSDGWLAYSHALDWAIFNNKEIINWDKRGKSGKGNGLWQRLKNGGPDRKVLAAEARETTIIEFQTEMGQGSIPF